MTKPPRPRTACGMLAATFLLNGCRFFVAPPVTCTTGLPDHPGEVAADVIIDQPFDTLESLGWGVSGNSLGLVGLALDSTAPRSPPSVVQFRYPEGYTGGEAPGTPWVNFPVAQRLLFTFWWKANEEWQGHLTGSNKLAYVFGPDRAGSITLVLYGSPGGPYELRAYPQFSVSPGEWLRPNVNQVAVSLGQWHQVQWLLDTNRRVVRWWLDGQLIGDYCGVAFPDEPLMEFKLAAVWGGLGDTKQHDDYFRYDHVLVSAWPSKK